MVILEILNLINNGLHYTQHLLPVSPIRSTSILRELTLLQSSARFPSTLGRDERILGHLSEVLPAEEGQPDRQLALLSRI